ncbi:MAG: hypothetical protein JOZ39_03750 [Chloroflexi bacterium]|nr:hypothetical protein [Chloroflexota bacterium]
MKTRASSGFQRRPVNLPHPIHIGCDEGGLPRTVHKQGRTIDQQVLEVLDCWRIDDGWWREQPVARLYYVLLSQEGQRLTVYHDLQTDEWFEQHAASEPRHIPSVPGRANKRAWVERAIATGPDNR